jgi:hypothetical protein
VVVVSLRPGAVRDAEFSEALSEGGLTALLGKRSQPARDVAEATGALLVQMLRDRVAGPMVVRPPPCGPNDW